MPPFSPSDGVNEREPTLISDGALQDTDGAEYRVGEQGLFVARGRDQVGDVGGVTGTGLYEAGFDGGTNYLIAHEGNSYHASAVAASLSFSVIDSFPSTTLPIVGTHYANRHYTANGVGNRRLELSSGVTSFPIGMSATTYAVGVSATVGTTGSMTTTTGLEYWVTEYDSVRGIESIHGATAHTGVFTGVTSVIVTVTGVSANPRADTIRWYRSVDGGGYPDGGLIRETAIGTTQITDTDIATGSLSVPLYGIISIGGLDTDRDEAPPVFNTIFGPFQDSLLAVAVDDPRTLRFTPAGYADSWPSGYAIPFESNRRDEIVTGVALPGRVGVFCNDSVHVVYRLPRDSDSIFASGSMQEVMTDSRGCVSRRGATVFTPPGSGSLAAWVARDGIWASNLSSSPSPLTDSIDWNGRVSVSGLSSCRLTDDPINRRLVFIYRRASDTTHNTGVWYLDYQEFQAKGVRITFADHGPLADAVTFAATDGNRRTISIDSRSGNGQVYVEANQDVDDSQLINSDGAVRFRMRTKEFLPAGARGTVRLGKATWMHGAAPERVEHRFYFNRRDDNPEVKNMPDTTSRGASDVVLGRQVNSVSLEIESAGTTSYGVHWIDIEGFDPGQLGGEEGA
jgi:hypothetical protein